jgi:uncharacterized protein YkwD/LysM repeat protein
VILENGLFETIKRIKDHSQTNGVSASIQTRMRRRFLLVLFVAALPLSGFITHTESTYFAAPVYDSASELIAAVNEFRAEYDLPPYQVDNSLMTTAQQQSDYQASIGKITHDRADGSGPGDHGISSENIGGGYNVTSQILIHSQWTDYWHTYTLIGLSTGLVGAGVSSGKDGMMYYTLDVKNTGKETNLQVSSTSASLPQGSGTPLSTHEVITATAQDDGTVYHKVEPGETLWDLARAYDVSIDTLASLNNLDASDPVIYPGQELQIREQFTPTATPTITNTPLPPTRTLRPSRTPQPASATPALAGSPTPAAAPLLPEDSLINKPNLNKLGILIIVVAGLGLSTIFVSRILSRKKE